MTTSQGNETATDASQTAGGPVKKKIIRKGLAARPYRRLTSEVLDLRTKDTRKKLAVHESKIVLLKDKLEQYEREQGLRTQCDEE